MFVAELPIEYTFKLKLTNKILRNIYYDFSSFSACCLSKLFTFGICSIVRYISKNVLFIILLFIKNLK